MDEIDYKQKRKVFLMRIDEELSKMIVLLAKKYRTSETSGIAIAIRKELKRLNYKGEKYE